MQVTGLNPATAPIKAILFDKDGTLLDYHRSWAPINERSAAHASQGDTALEARLLALGGLDIATGRYRSGSLLAAGNVAEIAAAWIAAGSPFEAATLTRELDGIFCAGVAAVVPVTDLAAYFRRLRARRLILGIASNASEAEIHSTLARFECSGLIDFVAGYDSGFGVKPEPGMLAAFAASISLAPVSIAMVGDNWHDLEMGRRGGAGLRVGVLTGTGSRADLTPHADVCLDSICELETALFD